MVRVDERSKGLLSLLGSLAAQAVDFAHDRHHFTRKPDIVEKGVVLRSVDPLHPLLRRKSLVSERIEERKRIEREGQPLRQLPQFFREVLRRQDLEQTV